MRRREFITLLRGMVVWPFAVRAQQGERIRKIGVLMGIAESNPQSAPRVKGMREELRQLGWTEGHNLQMDFRWAAGDPKQVMALARELVDRQPDLIIAQGTPTTAALLQQTSTIPIVFVQVADPITSGFIQSFARPGGNATGFTNFEYSTIAEKWLEMLKQIAPRLTRVAVLFNPETAAYSRHFLSSMEVAGSSLGLQPIPTPIRTPVDIEQALNASVRESDSALAVLPDIFTGAHLVPIIAGAARHRLPAMYPFRIFAESGGLISYGSEPDDLYRRAVGYADRILKGSKPADLPVQAPTKFELVINLKTAKTLGLTVPPTLLARADEVIE
jgi:putative tryptophan/tyrosine transport system substrate-binding protein